LQIKSAGKTPGVTRSGSPGVKRGAGKREAPGKHQESHEVGLLVLKRGAGKRVASCKWWDFGKW